MTEHGPKDPLDEEIPPLPGDDETAGARGFVADAVRKAVLAGMGAIFMTEEGARRLARDWKLPKEVLSYIGGQASGAKDEILRVITTELRRFFESEVLRREFLKMLTTLSLEVKAEVRFKETKSGKSAKPSVKASISPKFSREDDEDPTE